MTQEEILEYIGKGGKLFSISNIDMFRDGGTRVIETDRGFYYINKDSYKFQQTLSEKTLITDPLLIEYLISEIEKYIEGCERSIKRDKSILAELIKAKEL